MSKRVIETSEQVVKDEFGNERIRTTKKVVVHKMENENFYMVFANYVGWLYNLKGVIPVKVLHFLMERAQVNTGKVSLSTGTRQLLLMTLGISRSALSLALKQLTDVGAISRLVLVDETTGAEEELRGEYMINPEMLWKGDKEKRTELKVTFEAIYSKK